MTAKDVAHKIRTGELDCNSQQLFFSKLIKSLMVDLRNLISIRNVPVPHMILNTGDDTMWLISKGYDASIEPNIISNENTIYNTIPRCVVSPRAIDMVPDQLTSPHVTGVFQFEHEDQLYTFNAEFRRMPIKMQVGLKYILDSFGDMLEMMQHVCTKLAFIRTFKFVYLGQTISASYKIPESFEDQHMAELSGDTQEDRNRTIELSIELESFIPVYSQKTVHEATPIAHTISKIKSDGDETIVRDATAWPRHRSIRKR